MPHSQVTVVVGAEVGVFVGNAVGVADVGVALGVTLGDVVAVGADVGTNVGVADGNRLGAADGSAVVGVRDGTDDGTADGVPPGLCVTGGSQGHTIGHASCPHQLLMFMQMSGVWLRTIHPEFEYLYGGSIHGVGLRATHTASLASWSFVPFTKYTLHVVFQAH
jgi:hypothetical protein